MTKKGGGGNLATLCAESVAGISSSNQLGEF